MNAIMKTQFVRVYRDMIKAAYTIPNYSYREFAIRRLKEVPHC